VAAKALASPAVRLLQAANLCSAPQPEAALLHGGSTNVGRWARKSMTITFHDAGTSIGLPAEQAEAKASYDALLKTRLRPERRHIISA
jgi:hypothetical protein